MKRLITIFTLVFLLFPVSSFANIKNLGQPLEGLYRGAKIESEKDFKSLKELNVTTIITLTRKPDDEALCKRYNMNCIHMRTFLFPWFEALQKTKTSIIKTYWLIKKLLTEKEVIYLHCRKGSDRTGQVVAALQLAKTIEESKGLMPEDEAMKVITELNNHDYSHRIYPGIKIKIYRWMEDHPEWFTEEPK